jgi:plastocyanin
LRVRLLVLAALFQAAAAAADQTVDIGPGLAFNPPTVVVAPGEAVTWIWQESPHSSTSDATSGPEVWNSGIRATGATFSHTFQSPGDYPYYCLVHSFPGGTFMNGLVRVAQPTATPTVTPTRPGATATRAPVGPAAIPALSGAGRLLLGLALAAAAALLLSFARPR